jgi:excisionase family DNA binding protein
MAQAPQATVETPYLTADEAAAYLRYPSTRWFRRSVKRYGIPCVRRGRRIFFTKEGLDQFMAVADEATNGSRKSSRRRKAH